MCPRILHINIEKQLCLKEFEESDNLSNSLRRILSNKQNSFNDLQVIKIAGHEISQAHDLHVSFGDFKPDNIIVASQGRLCFVDLEQETLDGNQVWDIADFLYIILHIIYHYSVLLKL